MILGKSDTLARQKEIGLRIERMRKRRGYTQEQMGKWLDGRSGVQYGAIERGYRKTLDYHELERIAQLLEVPLSYITSGYPEPAPLHPDAALADLEVVVKSYIPVFDQIPEAEPLDYVAMSMNPVPESVCALAIPGLHFDPEIKEGDVIVADKAGKAEDGDIVICVHREIKLRRIRIAPDGMQWFEDGDGNCEEDQGYYGVVLWVQRKIKR